MISDKGCEVPTIRPVKRWGAGGWSRTFRLTMPDGRERWFPTLGQATEALRREGVALAGFRILNGTREEVR